MAVENWPTIAATVARLRGGRVVTGEGLPEEWVYSLVAVGAASRGKEIDLGRFAFPDDQRFEFADAVYARLQTDGMTAVTQRRIQRPEDPNVS
jgi:hypothetical protein